MLNLSLLLRSQWFRPDRLRRIQDEKLRKLVGFVYRRVPFYRSRFESVGLVPSDIRGIDDLYKIPLITKQDLQQAELRDVTASGTDLSRCYRSRTSGSTGVPLEILTLPSDRAALHPSYLRAYMAWGYRPWHRAASFHARSEALSSRSWYENIGIFRRRNLSSLDPPDRWIKKLRRWKPFHVHGYVLTLKLLAETVMQEGIEDLHFPVVSSTSGLLDKNARQLIRSAFQTSLIDIYGSEEAGSVIAWECPTCSSYHVNTDCVVLELLREGKPAAPGEEGEIVITNLNYYTMPFIRYEQGDRAVAGSGEPICGRGFPLIRKILGRAGDYIVLPSGRKLTPHPFFLALDHVLGVGEWRITQESLTEIHVEVTLSKGNAEELKREVNTRLQGLLEPGMVAKVSIRESIRRDPSQKLRSVVSHISAESL